jgi:hypothetical protein
MSTFIDHYIFEIIFPGSSLLCLQGGSRPASRHLRPEGLPNFLAAIELLALVLQNYAGGVYSGRKIEERPDKCLDFTFISCGLRPDNIGYSGFLGSLTYSSTLTYALNRNTPLL